ncbi:hypothetical protein H0H93_004373 [Arthromyces matolae]|nr:hypothetical protein H0H93_004373 [Arthromyces matolae]
MDPNKEFVTPAILGPKEVFWRDHYDYFKKHGYTLRDRYRPGWVPSWLKDPSKEYHDCEDAVLPIHPQVIDAVCSDGTPVSIKDIRIDTHADEILVAKHFSSSSLAKHPKNHCVPVLDVLDPLPGSRKAFLVMPLLFNHEYVEFETIGEVVDFCRQIFEGLEFMHTNNVIHGDCKWNNTMADALCLFSSPPHPVYPFKRRNHRGYTSVRSRTKKPIKYFLIDFGLSQFCPPEEAPHLREPPWGGDLSVPEFSFPGPPRCDLYAVDIYCIGNLIRTHFLDDIFQGKGGYVKPKQGFEFLRPLLDDMVNSDPLKRPSMTEVVSRFEVIVKGLNDRTLRSPVLEVGTKLGGIEASIYWFRQWTYRLRGIPAVPHAR